MFFLLYTKFKGAGERTCPHLTDQRSGKPRRVRRQHYMGHCAMGCASRRRGEAVRPLRVTWVIAPLST